MNIKRTLIRTALGAALCTVLRLVDFLFFYDGEFLTNNGLFSLIGIGIVALILIGEIVPALQDKGCRTVYVPGRSPLRGITASAAFVAAGAGTVGLFQTYMEQHNLGVEEFSATGLSMRLPFLVMSILLCVYLLAAAVIHLTGKEELFAKARLLELVPVLWGLIFVLYVFIHYSVSFMLSENLFVILCACALTISLTDKAKYLSAVNEGGKGLRTLAVTASLAAMLSVGYVLSNLVLGLVGGGYIGDLPLAVQIIVLFMSVNVLIFVGSSQNQKVEGEVQEHRGAKRYK